MKKLLKYVGFLGLLCTSLTVHAASEIKFDVVRKQLQQNGIKIVRPENFSVYDFVGDNFNDAVVATSLPSNLNGDPNPILGLENLNDWNNPNDNTYFLQHYAGSRLDGNGLQALAGQFDADPAQDVVIITPSDVTMCFNYDGENCSKRVNFSITFLVNDSAASMVLWAGAVADLDGDNKDDLVVIGTSFTGQDLSYQGYVAFLKGNQDGNAPILVGDPKLLDFGIPLSLTVGNFSGDAAPDVMVAAAPPAYDCHPLGAQLYDFRNLGNMDFQAVSLGADLFQKIECYRPSDIDAFNADQMGTDDLVLTCYDTLDSHLDMNENCVNVLGNGNVFTLKNNGNDNFAVTQKIDNNSFTYSSTVDNFNNDAFPDLIVASHSLQQVISYEGTNNPLQFNLGSKKSFFTSVLTPKFLQAHLMNDDQLVDPIFNGSDVRWPKVFSDDADLPLNPNDIQGVGVMLQLVGPECGNGITEGVEECDDGNQNDGDACLNTCVLAKCGDGILNMGVEACDDGNQNNNDGCTNLCEVAACGDGFVQMGEECDDANQVQTDGCLNTCLLATCGDGFVEQGVELCDDGNNNNNDACTNNCGPTSCGDGVVQMGEACDDGNQVQTDGCLNSCVLPSCGDNFIQMGVEQCDNGPNNNDNEACTSTCKNALCGDGLVLNNVEECDDGNQNNADACNNMCKNAVCGDGIVQMGEACDDGNQNDNDACTTQCALPSCGDGIVQPGEECDLGMVNNNNGICTLTCKLPVCGDGFQQAGEFCDDGNQVQTDDCLNTCQLPVCGDGFAHAGVEACDDGNQVNDDACTNNCGVMTCGDGIVQMGEDCDDQNLDPNDSCLNSCLFPSCGDGFLQVGVELCDDGNQIDNDSCSNACIPSTCGDGFLQQNEECDLGDANADTAACTASCRIAVCGDGLVQAGTESCDDANQIDNDACTNQCTIPGQPPPDGGPSCPAVAPQITVSFNTPFSICVDESLGQVVAWKDLGSDTSILSSVAVNGNCFEAIIGPKIDEVWTSDSIDLIYTLEKNGEQVDCTAQIIRNPADLEGSGCSLTPAAASPFSARTAVMFLMLSALLYSVYLRRSAR